MNNLFPVLNFYKSQKGGHFLFLFFLPNRFLEGGFIFLFLIAVFLLCFDHKNLKLYLQNQIFNC